MNRQVNVILYDKLAGILSQNESGFVFEYADDYKGQSLSLSMPVKTKRFESDELHPFFASLAPEGWLKKQYAEIQKIDETDLLGMLIANGQDLIGAVRIERKESE